MPTERLGNASASVAEYDVVAQDSDSFPEFIRHVGLSAERLNHIRFGSKVRMVHMGPSLTLEDERTPIHAIGSACLTAGQIRQIGVFVDEQMAEYEAEKLRKDKQYVICPHVKEPDSDCSCRRFNCAGFVVEAYRDAGIDLVTTDADSLLPVSLETLSHAFPDVAPLLQSPKRRVKYGLIGDGPWPVFLAGYVMNAMNRSVREVREQSYVPQAGDAFFPSRSGEEA